MKDPVSIQIKGPFRLRGAFLSILTGIVFSGLFSYGVYVFAIPPSSPYAPGSTLDPSCTPGSANCTVNPPLYFSGSTLDISPSSISSGTPLRVKYNDSNYATLTVGSNGDLTVSTNTSGGGGNINFNSPTSSNATILSNSGILTLGGGITGDENLSFDFHDYSNKVVVTSSTGVSSLDFGSMNLSTTGILTLGGSTTGTLVTRVASGAPTESDTNGSLVVDDTGGRLYFRYGNSWHYIAQTGGFQIPNFETVDPISGEPIGEGDFVIGMIDKSLDDNALHGVWVRWDTLKQQLAEELALTGVLTVNSTSTVSGEETELVTDATDESNQPIQTNLDKSLLGKVKSMLSYIGITIKDGITTIANLAVENLSVKTAKIERLELVDSATGESYCTWIENGELKKEKGECGSVEVAVNNSNSNQETSEALQEAADNAAQNAVDKIEDVIQEKVEEEVQNQLGDDQNNSSESGETPSENSGNQSENSENQDEHGSENNDSRGASQNNEGQENGNQGNNNQGNNNASENAEQSLENNSAAASVVDALIENSTSALLDGANSLVKSLVENIKGSSAGLMDPLRYLMESLSSLTKSGISKTSGSIHYSAIGAYQAFSGTFKDLYPSVSEKISHDLEIAVAVSQFSRNNFGESVLRFNQTSSELAFNILHGDFYSAMSEKAGNDLKTAIAVSQFSRDNVGKSIARFSQKSNSAALNVANTSSYITEYLWIINPKNVLIQAGNDLLNFSQRSIVLQRSIENVMYDVSTNSFLGAIRVEQSLFSNMYNTSEFMRNFSASLLQSSIDATENPITTLSSIFSESLSSLWVFNPVGLLQETILTTYNTALSINNFSLIIGEKISNDVSTVSSAAVMNQRITENNIKIISSKTFISIQNSEVYILNGIQAYSSLMNQSVAGFSNGIQQMMSLFKK